MLACVGLVLSSPLIEGTSETWRRAKLSLPTRNWNCRIASTNGADSMSPTVPPSCIAGRRVAISTLRRPSASRFHVPRRTYLDDADLGRLTRLVDRHLRDPLNPILNGVRDVRDDLDGLAEVVSPSLLSPNRRQLSPASPRGPRKLHVANAPPSR